MVGIVSECCLGGGERKAVDVVQEAEHDEQAGHLNRRPRGKQGQTKLSRGGTADTHRCIQCSPASSDCTSEHTSERCEGCIRTHVSDSARKTLAKQSQSLQVRHRMSGRIW